MPLALSLVSFSYLPINYSFSENFSLSFVDSALASSYCLSLSLLLLNNQVMNRVRYILILASHSPPTPCPSDFLPPHRHSCSIKGCNTLTPPSPGPSPPTLDLTLLLDVFMASDALLAPQPSLTYPIAVSLGSCLLQAYLKSLLELSLSIGSQLLKLYFQ